ncbi:MAG TPA: hypothetical protein VGD78_17855 [Chthoniobacterales bacterium]
MHPFITNPCTAAIAATLIAFSGLAASPQLTVDASKSVGPIRHGATGFLYGLSEPNVPDVNLIAPLKPQVNAGKPPGGLQHPNGDVLQIADTFFAAGGHQIQIYMQDAYSKFPYENLGLADYLAKIDTIVGKVLARPDHDRFVYVPFNEPDNNWYNFTTLKQQLFDDWKTIYRFIHAKDPQAKIAGPNTSVYNEQFFTDFFRFCRDNQCLPEVTTWHELNTSFYTGYLGRYSSYRTIERSLGLKAIPVDINEYALFKDLSVPGELIQWIARLEKTRVDGGLAYWHISSNLDDLGVENNKANGGWWLYRWFGNMTGQQLEVTPPDWNAYGLQGVASSESDRHQVHVLFGGIDGSAIVSVKGLGAVPALGGRAHVALWATNWTGYEGVADDPPLVLEQDLPVQNGQVDVPVSGMKVKSAYRLVLSPATQTVSVHPDQPWSARYEAEAAEVTDGKIIPAGSLQRPYLNAASHFALVGSLDSPDSRVVFTVNVPEDGGYRLDVYYGNGTQDIAEQFLRVDDGSWQTIEYAPNLAWTFIGRKSLFLDLKAGSHTLTLAKGDPEAGSAKGSVYLDCIDLTEVGTNTHVAGENAVRYEAELADLAGNCSFRSDEPGFSGTGYVETKKGAATTFVTSVLRDAYYDVRLRYAGGSFRNGAGLQLMLGGNVINEPAVTSESSVGPWNETTFTVFLPAGINRIGFSTTGGGVRLDALDVTPVDGDYAAVYPAEAFTNTLTGTAQVVSNRYGHGGKVVGYVGKGNVNAIQFNNVMASVGGTYALVVRYANGERAGNSGGVYNFNLVDRGADVSVDGSALTRYYFRNTYGWNAYRTIVLHVNLHAGANTVRFSNPTAYTPELDEIAAAREIAAVSSQEAETASDLQAGNAVPVTLWAGSGEQGVGLFTAGAELTLNHLTTPADGEYPVVLFYGAPKDCNLELTANGASPVKVDLPATGSLERINSHATRIQLRRGDNEIRIVSRQGTAVTLDKVEVLQ